MTVLANKLYVRWCLSCTRGLLFVLPPAESTRFTPAMIQAAVDSHNTFRRAQNASDMLRMVGKGGRLEVVCPEWYVQSGRLKVVCSEWYV